ncbi:hypothetical protein [Micromonospora sp. NPDC023814]|uniref:hypothetical protein n=1 Tax=Micromonospora sp. NPDC023814 TaxID=3154596 RepID=UPI0033F3C39A
MRGSDLAEPAAGPAAGLRTEFPFVLPRGLVDDRGTVHRQGVLRLATARDEINPQGDPRVRQNPAYLSVLLLARTVTRIGAVQPVDTTVIERLFASDLAFLQDLYRRVNQQGRTGAEVTCPHCGDEFAVDLAGALPAGA